MAIFDRQISIADRVADVKRELADVKSSQIVGGDNLVVRYAVTQATGSMSVTGGATAVWRAVYTFAEPPSSAYTPIEFDWFSSDLFFYVEDRYDDYTTIGSTTEQAVFLSISPSINITLNFIQAFAKSTAPGTLTFTRVS